MIVQQQQYTDSDYAFISLQFKGKRGYPESFLKNPVKSIIKERKPCNVFGGIIRIKSTNSEYKYVIVQGRYTGKWSFPKGHININETPLECSKREIYEETGINNLPYPTDFIKINYGSYFIFDISNEIPLVSRDTNEIMDTKWATVDEIKNLSVNADIGLYIHPK